MEDMSQYPLELTGPEVPMVRFMNVTKSYGTLTVLDDLNLDVSEGEMVTVIGPSGSGKTTVLRMLMTLETINGGVIYVDGKPLTHMEKNGVLVPADAKYLRRARSSIGMCFQHFNLFPHMTAIQNCMEGPVQVLGLPKAEARERSEELLSMVGMTDKKDQHPSRLSGGQQQRVAIARALAMRPKVMLFDEVTAALDPETVKEVLVTIRDLAEDGMTCILVTHEMGFAREVADHIYFTDRGVIVEHGPPATFFTEASDPRTQEFLGQIL